jgi:hypothetical protein
MRRAAVCLGLALSLGVAACRREPVVTADLPEGAPPPPPAELSQFAVPFEYDFSAVMRTVERVVPTHFGSLDSVRMVGNDDHKHYAFEADRGPFEAFADGRLMHLRSTLEYTAKGFYKPVVGPTIGGGCGKAGDRPRIVLELATPLTLTASWRLQSHVKLDHIAPASGEQRDHCDVSFLHHDVTARVVEAAEKGLTAHLADIDAKIGSVDLRDRFSGLWTMLARPIRLTDGVWLQLDPQRLDIGAVTGEGHILTVPVTLSARPRIVTSATPPTDSAIPLPPLGHAGNGTGFRVVLDGTIAYAAASKAISDALVNKSITEGGKTVFVNVVRVTPANKGRLALSVDFTGDARGTLVFLGTPVLDSVHRQIVVPDLDYDLETDSQLINTFTWLRSDALRESFRDRARVPIDPALERGRALLTEGLNRKIGDVLTLSATVDSVALRGLYITRAGLVVRAEARGHAGVKARPR